MQQAHANFHYEILDSIISVLNIVCRLFSEKGEKLKTLDFKTGAGTYTVNTKKGSYSISGDRGETLGTNMYVSLSHFNSVCITVVEYISHCIQMYIDTAIILIAGCNSSCTLPCTESMYIQTGLTEQYMHSSDK